MFKDYLSKVDPAEYPTTPVTSGSAQGCSPTPSAPISYPNSVQFCHATSTFSGSAALATAVSNTAGSIGYVEYGFAELNQLATANLVNASGKSVGISEAGILADANAGIAALKTHGGFNTSTLAGYSINNAVGAKVYPIAGFSYAIVVKNVATAATPMTQKEGITVAKFLEWLTHTGSGATTLATFGQNLARPNGYVGLPAGMEGIAQALISELNFNGTALLAKNN
jgi:phosphate transport system substrate-binding protein